MNKDKKLRLLLLPLIFIVLLHVPIMIVDIGSESIDVFLQAIPNVRIICGFILGISMLIWCFLFYYIPIGVYIAIVAVYTIVSWKWILKQKKGNAVYAIVWLVLCVLSILMYWKWGNLYHIMINQ